MIRFISIFAKGVGQIVFKVLKMKGKRNRAFVLDRKGNKLFYGTLFQCGKFIKYMEEGSNTNARCTLGKR